MSNVPPGGPRKRRLAQPEPNGASGSTPRDEAINLIGMIWNRLLKEAQETEDRPDFLGARPENVDRAIHAEGAIAIATGLLYVGDEIRALRDEIHRPDGQRTGPLAELFRDTTGGAA